MNFNWQIDLGDVIAIVAMIAGGLKVLNQQAVINFKVDELWKWKKSMTGEDNG